MTAVTRIGDGYSCGDTQAIGSGNVFANGVPIARSGDATAGHSCYLPSTIIATASTVFVNNIPIGKLGDLNAGHVNVIPCTTFHTGVVVVGSPDVFAEGP